MGGKKEEEEEDLNTSRKGRGAEETEKGSKREKIQEMRRNGSLTSQTAAGSQIDGCVSHHISRKKTGEK